MENITQKFKNRGTDLKAEIKDDGTVEIWKTCSVTKEKYSVSVPLITLEYWFKSLKLIQHVFPDLSEDHREFLISGTTPAEWDAYMGEEEE
jgi:hypothetical protein